METWVFLKIETRMLILLAVPYWDYATNPKIPAIAADINLDVLDFDGSRIQYTQKRPNPMFSYRVQFQGRAATFSELPDGLAIRVCCVQQSERLANAS